MKPYTYSILPVRRFEPTFTLVSDSTTGSALAEGFIEGGCVCLGVISHSQESLRVGTTGLRDWASTHKVSYSEVTSSDQSSFYLSANQGDPGFLVISWPELIDVEKLKGNGTLLIGVHPTPLPFGRGRHPLHWTLAMGLERLVLTFFMLDSGIDTGDVLLRASADLNGFETLEYLMRLQDSLAREGAQQLGDLIARGHQLKVQPQNGLSTYWRKRNEHDITIDFRMSSKAIAALVRSFGQPFEGCRVLTGVGPLLVTSCEVLEDLSTVDEWRVPGTIILQDSTSLTVQTSDSAVRLHIHSDKNWQNFQNTNVKFLHPPSFYV